MPYTQSQKKCTVESCVCFWEQCRQMNFIVYSPIPKFLSVLSQFSGSDTTLPGALDLDPRSQGKSRSSWCVSFETECTIRYILLNILILIQKQKSLTLILQQIHQNRARIHGEHQIDLNNVLVLSHSPILPGPMRGSSFTESHLVTDLPHI